MDISKELIGLVATVIAFLSYALYFKQILFGKVKPHAFTWLVWGIMSGIVFAAQLVEGGGAGAWPTGLTSAACFSITILGLTKAKAQFVKSDWIFLASSLISLFLWYITSDPTIAVILITLTDLSGTLPTIRKSYRDPHEESATLFMLSFLKHVLSLFALESYSLATWLFPGYLVLANALVGFFILARRRSVTKKIIL
jgi:hypothetical protein